jgi:nucleoside-diphosphate-sugar epimerase
MACFFIGPPGAVAHYVHVNDVAKGLWLCGVHSRAAGKIFIVADDHAFEELVLAIAKQLDRQAPTLRFPSWFCSLVGLFLGRVLGFPLTLSRISALTDRTRYRGDKIVSELGFKCDIDMSEGMQRMVRCLKDGVHTKR